VIEINNTPSQALAQTPSLPVSTEQSEYEKELRVAYTLLNYDEGYPTLDGMPFWVKLSFEPSDAYEAFQEYLKLGAKRSLFELSMNKTLEQQGITLERLEDFFHLYYWSARAKTFEAHYRAFRRRQREVMIETVEDEHLALAEKIFRMCEEVIEERGDELKETMTPKALMEFLKQAGNMQRLALRLPVNGPASDKSDSGAQSHTTVDVALRTVQEASAQAKGHRFDNILDDPEATRLAQDLILRISTKTVPVKP